MPRRTEPGVTLVSYRGAVVAIAGATRFYLAPDVEALGRDHPLVGFVALMCAYAARVRHGQVPGPYSDVRAELFARSALMDDDEFRHLDANRYDDVLLAGHFQVPIEQVAAKRVDLSD